MFMHSLVRSFVGFKPRLLPVFYRISLDTRHAVLCNITLWQFELC